MLCVCVGDVMDVMFSVCIVRRCMFVSCVYPVSVLNTAFCMTCSLLMLVENAIGGPYRRGILQSLVS